MKTRAGFTLLELMIGLTVAAIALSIGAVALGTVRDRSTHAEAVVDEVMSGATQRALLVEWLAGARFRAVTGEQFEGMQNDEGGRLVDQLMFPTSARTPLGTVSTVVGLFIDDDADTPERGLVAEMTGTTFGAEPRRMELVPQAGVMYLRYMTVVNGVSIWTDTWAGRNGLPRLVELTLLPAPGERLPELLRHPIRVAMGGGL